MIQVYTERSQGQDWLKRYRGCFPTFVCVLGFTETGLIPGISAAGATPADRRLTAIADAEFLINGVQSHPQYPLPPLLQGVSPGFISRAIIEQLELPVYLFNAGLPQPPVVPHIDLEGTPANCVSTGQALPLATVKALLVKGQHWGAKLAQQTDSYLLISECVVGGTTTALALLTGLEIAAVGKVNSSHPTCNHLQKQRIVQRGLRSLSSKPENLDPLAVVAAVGDPMQIVVAGMAMAASQRKGVMLAGGTQMLAVYALMQRLGTEYQLAWQQSQVVVGTTRWVAQDPTGDTVGLAAAIGSVTLLGTQLSFAKATYPQLRAYEAGFVKEGVGAGGSAIAASLAGGWSSQEITSAVEALVRRYYRLA
jgi:uncharacterized protein (TIGR00303 family)